MLFNVCVSRMNAPQRGSAVSSVPRTMRKRRGPQNRWSALRLLILPGLEMGAAGAKRLPPGRAFLLRQAGWTGGQGVENGRDRDDLSLGRFGCAAAFDPLHNDEGADPDG